MTRILVVRLGAMGDVIHALPAVATLRAAFPETHLTWVIKPRWMPLIEGNPNVDEVVPFERSAAGIFEARRRIREEQFDIAVDLQGLIQSALIAKASRALKIVGLARSQAREKFAARFYSCAVETKAGAQRIDRYLELAAAAGATTMIRESWLPAGTPEGELPEAPFVLACPFAGWASKQWPLERYSEVAAKLRVPLVVNGAPDAVEALKQVTGARVHLSGVAGLIDATRRAQAVIGVDSGPLHLAAALGKPGVAIFGPSDPATHGPYGGTIRVLRRPDAVTSYKRKSEIDESMKAITAEQVVDALGIS